MALADGSVIDVRTPNSDAAGDPPWQRAQAMLAAVMARERGSSN